MTNDLNIFHVCFLIINYVFPHIWIATVSVSPFVCRNDFINQYEIHRTKYIHYPVSFQNNISSFENALAGIKVFKF